MTIKIVIGWELIMTAIEEDIFNLIDDSPSLDYYKNKTVLITGANGMIPAYFVYLFLEMNNSMNSNVKVIALVRNKEKAQKKFANYIGNKHLIFLVQDVCDPIILGYNIDIIIHAASQASPKYYGIDPVGTINSNVLGTNNLLNLAKEKNVSNFLFLSSSEVYGIPDKKAEITEDGYGYIDILNIRSCYAESKRLAETMCVSWHHQFDIPIKIARIHHTYGPGMLLDDGRVFADFVENIVNNTDIIIKSDGLAKRPFCYITDCISAMLRIMMYGEYGQAYNIANIKNYLSVKELANLLVSLYPEKKLQVKFENMNNIVKYLPNKIIEVCPNVDKITSLGWSPTVDVSVGFNRTINSFMER